MTVPASSPLAAAATVAVAPTETVVLSVSQLVLRSARRLTIGVENLDATQTFAGVVYRRMEGLTTWAPSTLPDFAAIGPLEAVVADLDVEGTDEVELRGTASGAGLDVRVMGNRKAADS